MTNHTGHRAAVEAHQLVRRYGALTAVDGLTFAVCSGECFGLLGPNGAGKTTTIRMVACRLPPTSGELRVLGQEVRSRPAAIRRRLGVVPQDNQLDPNLTVLENLYTYGLFYGLSMAESRRRASELLEFMDLAERAHVRTQELSGGMRRRVAIARALMGAPELLILDEPSTGLDPQARHLLWARLAALRQEGTTILLSTHYMEEAARLCDRVAVMHRGRFVEVGPPGALVERYVGRWAVELDGDGAGPDTLFEEESLPWRAALRVGQTRYYFTDELPGERAARLLELHRGARVRPANLEDVFMTLTGRPLGDEGREPADEPSQPAGTRPGGGAGDGEAWR